MGSWPARGGAGKVAFEYENVKGLFTGEDGDEGSEVTGGGTKALEEAHVKYACVFPAFMFSYIGMITMSLNAAVANQTRI